MVVLECYIQIGVTIANAAVKVFFMQLIVFFDNIYCGDVCHRIKRWSEPGSRCSQGWWRWIGWIGLTSHVIDLRVFLRRRRYESRNWSSCVSSASSNLLWMKYLCHRIKRWSEPGSRCSQGWWRWIGWIGLTSHVIDLRVFLRRRRISYEWSSCASCLDCSLYSWCWGESEVILSSSGILLVVSGTHLIFEKKLKDIILNA